MKLSRQRREELCSATITQALAVVFLCSGLFILTAYASDPSWWSTSGPGGTPSAVMQPQVITNTETGVVTTNYIPNNYTVVTQGQLKHFTVRAVAYLNGNLTNGGAGTNLNSMVSNWAADYSTHDYSNPTNAYAPYKPSDLTAITVGQLKYIGSNVWTQLVANGYTNAIPSWFQPTNTDTQLAVLGQLKEVFNFQVSTNTMDTNGLSYAWETEYFGHTGLNASSSPDGNGFTLLQDYQGGANPTNYYSQPTTNGLVTIVPAITILTGGNNQTSAPSSFAPQPLGVKVTNSNGGAELINAPLTFAVGSSDPVGGLIAASLTNSPSLTVSNTTDGSGQALVYFQQPSGNGVVSTITASSGGQSVTFTETSQILAPVINPLSILVTFNSVNGAGPGELFLNSDGNLYGTTSGGGAGNDGTVFQMTPSGTLTTLYSFTGGADGKDPTSGLMQGSDGNFYGTTSGGGSGNYVTVFKITPGGTLTTVGSIYGGMDPEPGRLLVQDGAGNLYGTIADNEAGNNGFVFKVAANGTLTTLYSFSGTDGSSPLGVVIGNDGNLYGVTASGGSAGDGTVFRLSLSGTLTTLGTFSGTNGQDPDELIQGNDGNFYGTTYQGGANNDGTVFKLTPGGTLTTLCSFTGANGQYPNAQLRQGTDGNLYGTTIQGGSHSAGTAFMITPSGTLTTLYSFDGTDAGAPYAGLVQDGNGQSYGTASEVNGSGSGGVYELTPLFVTATVGKPFSYQIPATNNPASYGVSGTLPPGTVGLNTSTGLISGTPSAAGTYTVTISATNGGGAATASLTIVVQPAPPVGWWKFDEGSGTIANDSSGQENNGTLLGDPTWVPGVFNDALFFDGLDQSVQVNDSSSLDLATDGVTISAWFQTWVTGAVAPIVSKGFSDSNGYHGIFMGLDANGHLEVKVGDATSGQLLDFSTQNVFADNQWHQVVVVIDQTGFNASISVDGKQQLLQLNSGSSGTLVNSNSTVNFTASGGFNTTVSQPLYLGGDPGNNPYFVGILDDIRIYNYALSSAQVGTLEDDEDGSGLPVAWELQYFGQTGIDPNALDGSGFTNAQSFADGLDPTISNPIDTNGISYVWEWQNYGQIGIDPYGDPTESGYPNIYKYSHGVSATSVPAADFTVDAGGSTAYRTIQSAISATTSDYQIIAVMPGTYPESYLSPPYKTLIRSTKGAATTVINEQGTSYVQIGQDTILDDFAITNATSYAIYAYNSATARLVNCVFYGNTTSDGVLYAQSANLLATNCTLCDNTLNSGSYAVQTYSGTATLTNCILWDGGNEIGTDWSSGLVAVTANYCDIEDNTTLTGTGTTNITSNPLVRNDGHIMVGSPCIDAGTSVGAPDRDMDNESRPQGAGYDIGADEYLDTNGNGLPDWWQLEYFGALGVSPTALSPNGDQMTNLQNYQQQINPTANAIDTNGISFTWEWTNYGQIHIDPYYDPTDSGYPAIYRYKHGVTATGTLTADYTVDAGGSTAYRTIQSALSATGSDYKIIAVMPGTYQESYLNPLHKTLIRSTKGAATTVINEEGTYMQISQDTILDDFSVTNATSYYAINADNNATARLVNCVFYGNTPYYGVLFAQSAKLVATNCTLCDNTLSSGRYAVQTSNGTATLTNCILWDGGSEIGTDWSSGLLAVTATYCDIEDNTILTGTGNITSNPLVRNDGHITVGSPCIDAGTSVGAPNRDMDNESRPQGAGYDIGADEYLDTNGNGLPDWWQLEYFGALGVSPTALSPNGDQMTNLQNYQQQIDPTVNAIDTNGIGIVWEWTNYGQLGIDPYYDPTGSGYPAIYRYKHGVTATGTPAADYTVDAGGSTAYRTIQSAITATTSDYQIIAVMPGTYPESYLNPAHKILIRSTKGAATTTINEQGTYYVEIGQDTILDDFAVTNATYYGIYAYNNATARLVNCVFYGNATSDGVLYAQSAKLVATNCTLCDNTVNSGSYAVQTYSGTATLTNCILWDGGNEIGTDWSSGLVAVTATYCDIEGSSVFPGTGNINSDPLLRTDSPGHISDGSPCIDTGTAVGAPNRDMDNESRPVGSGYDIGADEYLDTNGNGIPDWWQLEYFGALGVSPTAAQANGLTNLYLYLAQATNPLAANPIDSLGIPISWLHQYFPSSPPNPLSTAANGNFTIYQEWLAQTNPNDPNGAPYQVVGTVPQSMETGFARDQTIIFYLDHPLPANQVVTPDFVIYTNPANPNDPANGTAATGTVTILPGGQAVAFVPSPPLIAGAFDTANYNYELNISLATSGLHVLPYAISFSTVSLLDTAGLSVEQASPVVDAINVGTGYHPYLIMNEPLDPATVLASNILLRDAAGNVIATTVSFDYTNNALSIVPSTSLQPSTQYSITAGTGFKSMAGQSLLFAYEWYFTTMAASTPPDPTSSNPYVLQVQPAPYSTGISLSSAITVFFSQPMDPTTLTSQTVHLQAYGQSTDLPTTLTYSTADNSLTIQPTSPLPGSTVISLVLDAANILSSGASPLSLQPGVNTNTPLQTAAPPGTSLPTPPTLPPGGTLPGSGSSGGGGTGGGGTGSGSSGAGTAALPQLAYHYYWGDVNSMDSGCSVLIYSTDSHGDIHAELPLKADSANVQNGSGSFAAGTTLLFTPKYVQGTDQNTTNYEQNEAMLEVSLDTPTDPSTIPAAFVGTSSNDPSAIPSNIVYVGKIGPGPFPGPANTGGSPLPTSAKSGTPNGNAGYSGPAQSLLLLPVDIEPDAGQSGPMSTTGDLVPSTEGPSGQKHYVSPKQASSFVVLKANIPRITSSNFSTFFKWDTSVGQAVSGSANKWEVKRDTPGKFIVKLETTNGTVVALINVWIIWADPDTAKNQVGTISVIREAMATIGGAHTQGTEVESTSNWRFVFKINSGASSITDTTQDIPNLTGVNVVPPAVPGTGTNTTSVGYGGSLDLGTGATRKWDMSRAYSFVISNPNSIPRADFVVDYGTIYSQSVPNGTAVSLPTLPVGNDDFYNSDPDNPEDDNPYQASTKAGLLHDVGELSSSDAPSLFMPDAGGASNYTLKQSYLMEEFVRLEIGSGWYVISDPYKWKFVESLTFQGGQWIDNSADPSETGLGN